MSRQATATRAATRRTANERARANIAVVREAETGEWTFLCECGDPSCDETVHLSLGAYDLLVDSGNEILADGHPRSRARAARAIARDLRDSARALRAQAAQVGLRTEELRRTISFRCFDLTVDELLDAGEDVEALLDRADELGISPAGHELLDVLDDAITGAVAATA